MEDLRYPVGKFKADPDCSSEKLQLLIDEIAELPGKLRSAVQGLSEEQLLTPYRPGGWTVAQVVHHIPDSHMTSYIRFKLALTENEPTIKPFAEEEWAKLADSKSTGIEVSLKLLESLHQRWVILLRSLQPDDFKRTFIHPQAGVFTLEKTLQLYAWHGRHHLAHITSLKERNGW